LRESRYDMSQFASQMAAIAKFFDQGPLMYLASSAGGQPHVRAMSLIYHGGTCWCCTGTSRPKYAQLQENNKMEFTFIARDAGAEFHNIRASGKAIEIHDLPTRAELAAAIPFFDGYWESPEDPEFALYRLDIDQIEYHPPGGKEYFRLDVPNEQCQRFGKNFRKTPDA
jgi:uncharacterized pyridoxamine 5'-phosphate oxidase family protein